MTGLDNIDELAVTTPGQRRAADAMRRAHQLWPGVHAQVLAEEIRYGYRLLPWLGPTSRCVQLIDHILELNPKDLP